MLAYHQQDGKILEPARQLPVESEYDVVVVGGGIAGFGAGVAAARAGCKTLIIEALSMLGGLVTAGLVNIPLDFVCGIGADMFDRLKAVDGLWHRNSDPEKHKLILDRMITEAGCDVLFVSSVVDAIVCGDEIRGVVVENKTGRQAILAKRVIDCSGDADAAFHAGAEVMVGRPGDGIAQACSLEFRLGGVDWDAYQNSDLKANDPKWIDIIEAAKGDGDTAWKIENHLNWITHVPGRPEHCGQDEVSICMAHSRNCRPADARDLTRMYLEGREQADELWKFIKKHIPGFANCWLVDTGCLLGVRETRRVVGEYVIQGMDIASWAHFDDVVTISRHGYDLHNPDGVGNIKWIKEEIDGKTCYVICHPGSGSASSWDPPGGKSAYTDCKGRKGDAMEFPKHIYYDIPYRALLPVKLDNLLVAGRCLSADFMAQSGCRLIMACLTMGESAGTAAAMSLAQNVRPRDLNVKQLQHQLVANGVDIGQKLRTIPGIND
jgi:hypothetical protein